MIHLTEVSGNVMDKASSINEMPEKSNNDCDVNGYANNTRGTARPAIFQNPRMFTFEDEIASCKVGYPSAKNYD